jgi:hypothetical protein
MTGSALKLIGGFANEFFRAADKLGPVIGKFMDAFLARGPQFQALFGKALNVGIDAIAGLLTNALRLSDWFEKRLPVLSPVVSAVFGVLGRIVQGAGQAIGHFVDWIIANWPAIQSTMAPVLASIGQAFQTVTGFLRDHWSQIQTVAKSLAEQLGPAIKDIVRHSEGLRDILIVVGFILLAAAAAIVIVVTAAVVLASWFLRAWDAASSFAGGVKDLIGHLAGLAGGAIGNAIGAIEGAFNRVKNAVGNVIDFLGKMAGAIQNMPAIGGIAGAIAHRQGGGPMVPGNVYKVGEAGPETVIMGRSGGYVIPDGGGAAGIDRLPRVEGLLQRQNALLAAILQQVTSPPPPAGNWPFQGRA